MPSPERTRAELDREYDKTRKQLTRAQKARHRRWDPVYGVWISTLEDCPHGTPHGYNEYGCRCLDLADPQPRPTDPLGPIVPWGCRPAGVTASATRRATRRNATADTVELPQVLPPSAAVDSALAQLDRWMPRQRPNAPESL